MSQHKTVIYLYLFHFIVILFYIYFMGMNVLLECIFANHMPAWCEWRTEEGLAANGTGVTDGCLASRVLWALNPSLLKEQQVLLNTDPSL